MSQPLMLRRSGRNFFLSTKYKMPRRAVSQYSQNRWPRTTGFIAGATAAYKMKGALRAGVAPPAAQAVYNTAKKVGTYIRTKKNTTKSQLHQNAKLQVPGHGAGGTFTSVYMKKPLTKWLKGMKKATASNFSYVNGSTRMMEVVATPSIDP